MSSPFKDFDWKNGEITQKHKDYMRLWALNEIEILLGTQPTDEAKAKQYLAEICKSANIEYDKVYFVDSPKVLLDKVRASVGASVWASVGDSVGDSVRASVWASVGASVWDSVGASVRASVWASVGASVGDSVRASVWASVWDSVGASVRDSVWDSLASWYDSDWQYLKFYSEEFEKNALEPYCLLMEQITGLLKIGNDIYLVRKPTRLVRNGSGRLHYDHDKAIEWGDGYGFYCLNGVEFKQEHWQKIVNQDVTLGDFAKMGLNNNQRPAALQMLRPDRLLKGVGAKLVHTGKRGVRLYMVENFENTGETEYCLRMEHPSIKGKEYLEWIRPEIGKKHDADLGMASNRGLTKAQYLRAELA